MPSSPVAERLALAGDGRMEVRERAFVEIARGRAGSSSSPSALRSVTVPIGFWVMTVAADQRAFGAMHLEAGVGEFAW